MCKLFNVANEGKDDSMAGTTKRDIAQEFDFREIWDGIKKNKTILRIVFRDFNKITYFLYFAAYISMIASEVMNMIMVLGDMEKMTEASFLTLTHLVQISKVYAMFKYEKRIQSVINSINRMEFQPKNINQYSTLNGYIQDSKTISKTFLSACVVTCSFWGLYPFTEKGDIFLPLARWFPFDTSYSPAFEIAYIYQVFGSMLNGLTNITMDTFMSGLIMVVCAQLNILNDSLKNMRKNAEIELSDNVALIGKEISPQLQKKMDEKLVECVIHHRCILEYLPWASMKFFSLIFYQSCIMMEIFLWCYYGNEVILEVRNKLHIMKSSWSYFAVLNRVHSDEK
ncbi:hypothetical protein NQ314_018213 [Rhamnusium bicolor]|uniref:Odorant receptor n=1 Tax=Rhamnusium bicolor TaxID=1586634 RepID=A0AAV8WRI7_9CUCU|nr:hypothetical protein NQ314_018213 [Rhamnusium bicolor]